MKIITTLFLLLSGLCTAQMNAFDELDNLKAEVALNESFLRKGTLKPLINSFVQSIVSHQAVQSSPINPESLPGKLLEEALQMTLQYLFECAYLKKSALKPQAFPYAHISVKSSNKVLSEFLAKVILNTLMKDDKKLEEFKKALIFMSAWVIKEQLNKTTQPVIKGINRYVSTTSKKRMLSHACCLFAFYEMYNITKGMLLSTKKNLSDKLSEGLEETQTFKLMRFINGYIKKKDSEKLNQQERVLPLIAIERTSQLTRQLSDSDAKPLKVQSYQDTRRLEIITKLLHLLENNKQSSAAQANLDKLYQVITSLKKETHDATTDTPETPGQVISQELIFDKAYLLLIQQPESAEDFLASVQSIIDSIDI
jgi:hypothetical protein